MHEAPDSDASQKLAKRISEYASLLSNGDEQLAGKYFLVLESVYLRQPQSLTE